MTSLQALIKRGARFALLAALVPPPLGGCANDVPKRRLNEPVVENATPSPFPVDSASQVPSAAQTAVDAGESPAPSESVPGGDESLESDDASSSDDAPEWCVDIRIPIGPCFYDVPEAPPGRAIDIESLNLRLAGYNGDSPLDYPIERVSDSQACATTGLDEWYFRQDTEVPLLVLCPYVCGIGSQGGQGLLWVRAECL